MNEIKPCVLIVDKAPEMRRLLHRLLVAEGLLAIDASDMAAARYQAGSKYPNAMILDTDLPDGRGIDLIADIRSRSDIPILILTERDHEEERLAAFEVGADDYVLKPFSSRELLARLKAQLRRQAACIRVGSNLLKFDNLEIDLALRVVSRSGHPLHLTPLEYHLLTLLARHPGRVFLHQELLRLIWGGMHDQDTHYLRVHMRNLRKKIELDPSNPRYLLTETHIGYRFVP
ncbi:MAG: response regulator [Aquabacterium sp.]|uniref:winged helix-turn-helix domain-containing protein n=1 Tax=Aquabacterium sp. TaxID=1872578 RepID=UPI0011FEE3D3|nr:winged helix-turn-helix domain-containing protein [Aquabacterium sp.]TAK94030.1 MAG: response regulator [Aquabacterium sp.]